MFHSTLDSCIQVHSEKLVAQLKDAVGCSSQEAAEMIVRFMRFDELPERLNAEQQRIIKLGIIEIVCAANKVTGIPWGKLNGTIFGGIMGHMTQMYDP